MRSYKLGLSDWGFAILLWTLLIMHYGYTYGTNDHIELLPYVAYLHDPSLYPHDLFIQSLHASLPNERTVMAHLLLPFADHLSVTIFLLHFFNTVFLLLAMIRLARRFIVNPYLSWIAVFTSVYLLNDKGLGAVDIYTPSIQAGDVSCMVIAWALNLFLDRRYILTSIVMSLATFIHVLEGFDVMAVLCGVMLLKYWLDDEIDRRQLLSFMGIYGLTAGIYLLLIYRAKTHGAADIPQAELFAIMFAFRHPHHFIFATFPAFNKYLFMAYLTAGMLFYPLRSKTVFQFFAVAILILIVYIISVDVFHIVAVANFQWYKVVAWLKFLGIVAAFAYTASYLRDIFLNENVLTDHLMIGLGMVCFALMFYQFGSDKFEIGYPANKAEFAQRRSEIELCRKVKDLTPLDAVFIQPFEMTALKFYGQRSSYVEFKAIAKNQKDLRTWYARVQEVFGLDYHIDRSGFDMRAKADAHLDNLDEAALARLYSEGVTHLICYTDKFQQKHKLILSENGYFVYEL